MGICTLPKWGGENLTGSVRFEFFFPVGERIYLGAMDEFRKEYIYIYIYIAVVIKWLTKRGLQKLGSIFEAFYEK